ncbi:MAG: response regulator [Clostridiales bacterium]|nr:response regulator [Clostridiales bacterium]
MKTNRRVLILTLIATFVLMTLLVTYTTRLMYRSSSSYIHELGNDKTSAITAELENYLDTAKSVLWVTADTVDHMIANGASNEEIVEYITRESATTSVQFDDSYTGIYGVVRGEYVDGVGWTPPDDYDPTVRDWYKSAIEADGQPIIASPYVDAQTGNVIISVVQSLSDRNNVLGLDLTLSDVQEIVEGIQIDGSGYGYILNYDGTVIAHPDLEEKGKNYSEEPGKAVLFAKAVEVGKGNFNMEVDGKDCTVFVDDVLDQWHLVIVIESSSLLDNTVNILIVSIIINLVVFGLISAFYIIGYRYERKMNRRMEELKEIEQKKDYEAKLLKLEKSAADSANKAKSDFLADMSHEIRTPINAILGMNEMILRESENDQIIEYASNIKSAGGTLLSIINNILDFSKIEDGKMTLVPVAFDVAELIGNLVNSISERARVKGLEFHVDIDESVPSRLYGDDVRISQVIMNLLTNSVKYTETGSVTLSVKRKDQRNGNVDLRFEVIDTGIGIKEEDLDKLFNSFERIEERRNRHIEGTGLGLSIVSKLLSMMNSKLDVNSKYGSGSTFGFDLNLKILDPDPIGDYEERRKAHMKNQEDAEHLYAPKAKVLITDDNDMNLKVASNFMKIFGIEPVTCSSGKETIELLRKNKFDILFLDHMMPLMDGIETLKILKDEDLVDDTVVIALTANAVVGAEEQYLKAGFDGYLSKPIIIKDIEKTLWTYLPLEVIERGSAEEASETSEDPDAAEVSDKDGAQEFEAVDTVSPGALDSDAASPVTVDKARSLGLNVEAAIEYSCGEEELYIELLTDYAKNAEDKCATLASYLENNALANYRILIHSLKSSSRMVGADDLSALAKDLEDASARNDAEYVKSHHDTFVKEFKELAAKILG